METISSRVSTYSSQVQDWITIARQKCSLLTWLGIAATVIIGASGLRYSYVQQMLAVESTRLAEWTARKDFREICHEQAPGVTLNPKCEEILRQPFPEPPYTTSDDHDKLKRCQGVPLRWRPRTDLDFALLQVCPPWLCTLRLQPWTVTFTWVVSSRKANDMQKCGEERCDGELKRSRILQEMYSLTKRLEINSKGIIEESSVSYH